MKCEVCKKNIEITFLSKLIGAYINDKDGKKHAICANCQKQIGSKEEILKKITK